VAGWISARSRRKAELAGFAVSRGWAFTGRDDRWARIAPRVPFGTGLYRLADDVMRGPVLHYWGVAFSYTGGSGSSRVRAGVYALELLARMVDRLPDYVWTSRGVVPPRRGSAII
jgi:hypothetical protein